MSLRARFAFAFVASVVVSACTSEKSGPSSSSGAPTPYVDLRVSSGSVIANGTNTVVVTYTNASGGNAVISTSRGTFQEATAPGTSITVSAVGGTVTLVTCSGCSGVATLTITAPGVTSVTATVDFRTVATACRADCSADASCGGLQCTLTGGGTGACTAGVCAAGSACTPTATTETSCSDNTDNDCNGSRDCADSACDGRACQGGPTFFCRSGACTDITTGLAVTVTPARTRLPAVSGAATAVDVLVTSGADPAPALSISIALSNAAMGTITPATAATGSDGIAHFVFTAGSPATTGTETLTARIVSIPSVTGVGTVTIPRLSSLRLIDGTPSSVEFPVMGAKGSGWQDLGFIQVMAVDDLGLPYPDGLPVRFEHRQVGGSTLGVPLAADTATCLAAQECVGYQAVTASTGGAADTAGVAKAWIYSGTVAGTLPVTATATAAGATFTVSLPTIAVVGAKASGNNFAVVCSPRNLPALAESNCSFSFVDAPFTCEALLKDRFNNTLGRSTQVIFASEAGTIGQVTWTPEYNLATPGNTQMGLGLAVQGFTTLGAGLPFDVDPLVGEPNLVHNRDGCGSRTHNPRDGVVTIIAIADGEEAWFDANGNGTFDAGDTFVDLGEPYVDQDDSGTWTPGEWFLDLDGNGTWTGPNGRWDANTKIWTQTFVLFTGAPQTALPVAGGYLGTRLADPGDFVNACTSTDAPTPFDVLYETTVHPATSQSYAAVASDLNLNFLHNGSTYSAAIVPASADLTATYFGLDQYADLVGVGWRYWPCANNGAGPCNSQCRGPGICQMRADFTGYGCGLSTQVMVTGGTAPAAGSLSFEVLTPWNRYGGTNVVQHGGASVFGISH